MSVQVNMTREYKPVILFIAHSAELYGAEIVLLNLVTYLQGAYSIYVAVPGQCPLEERLKEIPGINIRYFRLLRFTKKKTDVFHNMLHFVAFSYDFVKLLKEVKPDLIYCNTIRNIVTVLLARLLKQKTILHIHEPNITGIMSGLIARISLLVPNKTIIISEFVRQTYLQHHNLTTDNSIVVYNGVSDAGAVASAHSDEQLSGYELEAPVLATIAQLIHRKRLGDIVMAMETIIEEYPTTTVLIIGDGFLKNELQQQIAAAGLGERIHLVGDRDDATAMLSRVDIFLCPFENEGFGLVAIEAMMKKIPVVAAASGALPEIITDGRSGILYPVGDIAAFAAGIKRLVASEELRREYGVNGFLQVQERFSLCSQMEKIRQIIDDLVIEDT
jgi:L-malate glycosyltransferase